MGDRYCSTCRTTSGDYSPAGWHRVFVNDPDADRGSRFLGLFCTTECLAAKLPEVELLVRQIDQLRAELDTYRSFVPPEPDDESRWLGADGATYERHDGWKATEGERRWYNTSSGGPDSWAEVWRQARPATPLVAATDSGVPR